MRITLDDINVVKELLNTLGIMYIDAPYEADEICAKLVLDKKVYACLSDDTDMFAYGCSKILTKSKSTIMSGPTISAAFTNNLCFKKALSFTPGLISNAFNACT